MSEPVSPSATPPDPSTTPGRQPPYGQFSGPLPEPRGSYEAASQPSSEPPVSAAGRYPQQQLLPQEVKPSRSRLPLLIGLAVVLALVGGGVAAWFLLHDDGEDTRAAYCAELRTLTNDGDLMGTIAAADESTLTQLEQVAAVAPSAVADDWQQLQKLASSEDISVSTGLAAFSALKSIVNDAEGKCGMDIPLPGL